VFYTAVSGVDFAKMIDKTAFEARTVEFLYSFNLKVDDFVQFRKKHLTI
jgi:hypothetical protein